MKSPEPIWYHETPVIIRPPDTGPRCKAVIVRGDGRSHSCRMPAFYDDVDDVWGDFCEYHLDQLFDETDWAPVVPNSSKRNPRGVELLAAVARGVEWHSWGRWYKVGGHHDRLFWALREGPDHDA